MVLYLVKELADMSDRNSIKTRDGAIANLGDIVGTKHDGVEIYGTLIGINGKRVIISFHVLGVDHQVITEAKRIWLEE